MYDCPHCTVNRLTVLARPQWKLHRTFIGFLHRLFSVCISESTEQSEVIIGESRHRHCQTHTRIMSSEKPCFGLLHLRLPRAFPSQTTLIRFPSYRRRAKSLTHARSDAEQESEIKGRSFQGIQSDP